MQSMHLGCGSTRNRASRHNAPPMHFYLHYLVFAPLLLLALLAVTLPGRNPLQVFGGAFVALRTHRGGKWLLGCFLFVTLTNLVQAIYDPALSEWLGYDFTYKVRAVEGAFVERVQDGVLGLPGGWQLTWVLALAYTAGYVAWLLYPAFAFQALGLPRTAGSYAAAFAGNYLFALPFYLFFPVREVAWSGISGARPLLEEHFPGITAQLRLESALDNCFPSLHVSIAVTAMYFVWRFGTPRMKLVGWPLTVLICASVVVLAIHWGLDAAAGVPFGLICTQFGLKVFPPEGLEAPEPPRA